MTETRPATNLSLWEDAVRVGGLPPLLTAQHVPQVVDHLLETARRAGASDVHLVPTESGLAMSWRIDGVLHAVARFGLEVRSNIVTRLKVMADLLTYQTETPQEGRIHGVPGAPEIRVSTFPTLFGEKAVVRLFAGAGRFARLDELGFPEDIVAEIRILLGERGGVFLMTGPAGSGKTTTAYAALRRLIETQTAPRSVVTLEDPIESIVEGAAQSQVRAVSGFTYETGLKSLLRQDPDVILVGEIRDPATARAVFQAALTGHLVLTTFHAGSAAEAISRLLDMGIEPYQLRSALLAVLNQRLLRRLCHCARVSEAEEAKLGLPVTRGHLPVGCAECHGTGYRDRFLISELLRSSDQSVIRKMIQVSDAPEMERIAREAGIITRWDRACRAVEAGLTSPAEVIRVFGMRGREA